MRRHLYIVINHGTPDNYLGNVDADCKNYLQFFTSANGGLWDEDGEITVYNDDFVFSDFCEEISKDNRSKYPLDYVVFVFCGHGYLNEDGQRCMEVGLHGDISEQQLFAVLNAVPKRVLLISDACQVTWTPSVPINEQFDSQQSDTYKQRCKELYNSYVMQMPMGTITAGYAVSKEECAAEDENGGIYSYYLLKVARELAKEDTDIEVFSFPYVHSITQTIVSKRTANTEHPQHPVCSQIRYPKQLPFVVKPNINII